MRSIICTTNMVQQMMIKVFTVGLIAPGPIDPNEFR